MKIDCWDVFGSQYPSFEELWKEEFSAADEVPHDWREAERFRKFAKRMYDYFQYAAFVQAAMERAFAEGSDEGYRQGENDMKDKIKDHISKL